MSLPTLEIPTFETILPSTQKKISYRPYLVKEEKILLMALETEDEKAMIKAMKDVIRACTFNILDADDMTTYDLEYLFLKIRAKSVGETTQLQFKCDKCSTFTPILVNLDEIEVSYPGGKKVGPHKIQLTPKIGISLKPLTVRALCRIDTSTTDKGQLITDLLAGSIETIYDQDKVYHTAEVPQTDVCAFIDTLNRDQLKDIQTFIENLPHIEKTFTFSCGNKECKHINTHTVKGVKAFFA